MYIYIYYRYATGLHTQRCALIYQVGFVTLSIAIHMNRRDVSHDVESKEASLLGRMPLPSEQKPHEAPKRGYKAVIHPSWSPA